MEVTTQLEAEHVDLGRRAAAEIFATLPSYAEVDEASVHTSVAKNTARAIATLVSRQAPGRGTSAEAAMTTGERLRQGVPIEDIIRGYRISLRVIHDRFVELATARRIPAEQILQCSNLLWDVGDWFTAGAATEYRNLEVRSAVRDSSRQVEVFRDLLGGTLNEAQVRAAANTLALDPLRHYAVFRLTPRSAANLDALRTQFDALTPRPELVTASGRTGWIGLVSEPASLRALAHVVALGPPRPIGLLAESGALAEEILGVVSGEPAGVYTIEDVTWRLTTHAVPAVAAHLRQRYLQPTEELGAFGLLLLESVRAFLQTDLNITRAAAALTVHQNTLRYRLAKYEELIGIRCTELNTAIELAWVLGLPVARRTARPD